MQRMTPFVSLRSRWIPLVLALSAAVAVFAVFRFGEEEAQSPERFLQRVGTEAESPETPGKRGAGQDENNSPNLIGMTERDRLLLNPMSELPESFARSDKNPYACEVPEGANPPCHWDADPLVARSEKEAEWMAAQGYPTLAERLWARTQSSVELLAEAERTGSTALWALGLERMAIESDDAELVAESALNLDRLASSSKSLYALERGAAVRAHLIELTVAENGWPEQSSEDAARIREALRAA